MSSDFEDYYSGGCFPPEKTSEDDNNSPKHSQPAPVNFSEDTPVFVKQENLDYPEVHFEKTANQELESNYFETPTDHAGYEGLQQSIIRMSYEIAEAQGDVDQNGQDVEDQSLPHVPCKKAKLKIELLNGFSPHTRKNICSSSFSTPVYVTSTKSCLPKNQNPANHIMSATGDSPCLNRCKEIGDTTYSIHTPLSTVDITSLISMAAQTANLVQSSAPTPNLEESSALTKNLDQSPAQTPNLDQSFQTSSFDQSSASTENLNQSSPPIQAEGSCIISTHQDTGTILYFPVAPYLRTLVDPGVGNPIDLSVRIPVDLRGATTHVETSGAGFCGEASGVATSEASEESADENALEAAGQRTLEAQDDLGEKTSDDLGDKTSDELDEKTSDDLGAKTSDDLGEKTADDLGEKTADDLGEMTSDDTDERSSDTIDVITPDVHGEITLESFQANVPTVTPVINTTSMPAYDAIAKTISKILLGSNGQPECLVTSELPDESQQQESSNGLSMLDTLHTRGDDEDDTERESHNMKERRRRARIKDACDLMRQLVPGMSEKTDKATVFEFAARYIYFLKGFVGGVHDKDFLIKYSPY